MKRFTGLKFLALAVVAGAMTTPAWAALEINIGGTVSGGTITGGTVCVDNAACDSNSAVGVIQTANTVLGTVTIVGTTSTSGSPIGTLSLSVNSLPSAVGSFTIAITDNNYNNPAPPLTMVQDLNGNTLSGDSASLTAVGYFGATNVDFDTSGTHTTTASTNINAATGFGSSPAILSGNPYSLTDFITVNISALGTGTNQHLQVGADLDTAGVPEPASILLLGSALLLSVTALKRKLGRS